MNDCKIIAFTIWLVAMLLFGALLAQSQYICTDERLTQMYQRGADDLYSQLEYEGKLK